MRNRTLWIVLLSALFLAACNNGGGDAIGGGGVGNEGGGDKIAADETAEATAAQVADTVVGPPCGGVVGTINTVGEPLCGLKDALCPVAQGFADNGVTAIKGAVQLLFGACDGSTTPKLKVYLTPFPRLPGSNGTSVPGSNVIPGVTLENKTAPKTSIKSFAVTVEGVHSGEISVDVTTGITGRAEDLAQLTATAGSDFIARQEILKFAANSANTAVSKNFDVTVLDDNICEVAENIGVRVRYVKSDNAQDRPLLARKSGYGAIADEADEVARNCPVAPPPVALACGDKKGAATTGKTLRAVARSYAYRATGQFAQLFGGAANNEFIYQFVYKDGVATTPAAGGSGAVVPGLGAFSNSADSCLTDTKLDPPNACATSIVANLDTPVISIGAATAGIRLAAARPQISEKDADGKAQDLSKATIKFTSPQPATEVFAVLANVGIAGMPVLPGPIPPNTVIPLISKDGEVGTITLNEQVYEKPASPLLHTNFGGSRQDFGYQFVNLAHIVMSDGSELVIGHNFAGLTCENESLPPAQRHQFTDPDAPVAGGGGGGGLPAPPGAPPGLPGIPSGLPDPNALCAPPGSPPPFAGQCL